MTPLHLRRRLRSALTTLRGVSPDEAAEVRAAYRVAYDCGDDEPIADLMRQAVGQIGHLRTRVDVLKAQLDAMDQAHADTLSAHYRVVGELDGIRAGLCTDGDTRDALRHVSAVLDDAGVSIPNCDRGQGCTSYHLTHRIHVLADERDALRTELATGAARQALNAIAAACGCAEWEYPGQVVRDVEAVVRERDEAVALISTVRAELAAAVEERDRLREALRPVADGNPGWTMVEDHNRARDVLAGTSTPKRKRTKEDGFPHRVGDQWVVKVLRASGRAMTSREIATEIDSTMVPTYMRWVSDLARAGYLTSAKGPGGVRVYSLPTKEEA